MNKEEIIMAVEKNLDIPNQKPKDNRLFIFFGIPGSGKTTVAMEIANLCPSVYISSDKIALSQNLDKSGHYHWTFEILNFLIDKYLAQGYNVIADSNSDKYSIRKELYDIAEKNKATTCCFWIRTDLEIALERQEQRRSKMDKLRDEHLFYITPDELKKYLENIEIPRETEKVYIIDGTSDIKSQLQDILLDK